MNKQRAELHIHTKYSDDISFIDDIKDFIHRANEIYGLSALAFTNLNNVQDFPTIAKAAKEANIKIIYGAELIYETTNGKREQKLTILIKNQDGVKNLYKILSALENDGVCDFVKYNTLKKYRKNLLIGSAGRDGELYSKIAFSSSDEEVEKLAAFYDYFEIYPPKDKIEEQINKKIVNLGRKLGVPVIAVSNAHYIAKEEATLRDKLRTEQQGFESDKNQNLYLRIHNQMEAEFLYLGEDTVKEIVYENPQLIVNLIEPVTPIKEGLFFPRFENDFEEIKNLCYEKVKVIYGTNIPKDVKERLNTELDLINRNGFSGVYYIVQKIAKFLTDNGRLITTRGTAGASFVAYLLGITGINPITYNISFESFMGVNGNKKPDFDIVIPDDFRFSVLKFLQELLGEDKIATPGIVKTYGENLSNILVGNNRISHLKTNDGIHPAGFMIIPQDMDFEDFTPLNKSKHWAPIDATHFDFRDLRNTILKLNIIESNVLTILENLQKKTSVSLNEIDVNDPKLFEALSYPVITDIPPLENAFVRSLLIELKPKSFNELLKIIGFSHGTNLWSNNGEHIVEESISFLDLPTFREDIFDNLLKFTNKKTAYKISDAVRKGLFARKKADDELIIKFKELSAPLGEWYFDYCSKIRYIFTKSHAIVEATNILQLIWFKIHYPKKFESVMETFG